jgi:hypothetical protein
VLAHQATPPCILPASCGARQTTLVAEPLSSQVRAVGRTDKARPTVSPVVPHPLLPEEVGQEGSAGLNDLPASVSCNHSMTDSRLPGMLRLT